MSEESIRAVAIASLAAVALIGSIALAWAPAGDAAAEAGARLQGALLVLLPAAVDAVLYAARRRRTRNSLPPSDPPAAGRREKETHR